MNMTANSALDTSDIAIGGLPENNYIILLATSHPQFSLHFVLFLTN
jgi:hypothetical protein